MTKHTRGRQNISIHGQERSAAQKAAERERFILRDWVMAYRKANMELPDSIKAQCEAAGVEVTP